MLNLESIEQAIRPLGLGAPTAFTELTGGTSPTYRLDFAAHASIVLKIYPAGSPSLPQKDAFAAAQLNSTTLPVTRHLLVDGTLDRVPFAFTVSNYLPGSTVQSFIANPNVSSLYQQTGALLRDLHKVTMPAYGSFDAEGIVDPIATNSQHKRKWIDDTVERFVAMGGERSLATKLHMILDKRFDQVVPFSRGPVFAHDDLHPKNVLAVQMPDGTLRLSGLIDFGNARADDATSDLAKCLFCSEHDAPGSAEQILLGYGPVDHPDPAAALSYYTILHGMVMWWWLRQIGVIEAPDTRSDLISALQRTAEQ